MRNLRNQGHTLVELLVGATIASIITTTLIYFTYNLFEIERTEIAKSATEKELTLATEFIAQEIKEATRIYYDKPTPPCPDCQVLIVFEKRKLVTEAIPVQGNNCPCDDTFVLSKITYYHIKDSNPSWSKVGRIERREETPGMNPYQQTIIDYVDQVDFQLTTDGIFFTLQSDALARLGVLSPEKSSYFSTSVTSSSPFIKFPVLEGF